MNEKIIIDVKHEKEGIKIKTRGESEKTTNRKKKIKVNGVRCAKEIKDFLDYQSKALIHLFKFLFYSLAWVGDTVIIASNNMKKKKEAGKKKESVKETFM